MTKDKYNGWVIIAKALPKRKTPTWAAVLFLWSHGALGLWGLRNSHAILLSSSVLVPHIYVAVVIFVGISPCWSTIINLHSTPDGFRRWLFPSSGFFFFGGSRNRASQPSCRLALTRGSSLRGAPTPERSHAGILGLAPLWRVVRFCIVAPGGVGVAWFDWLGPGLVLFVGLGWLSPSCGWTTLVRSAVGSSAASPGVACPALPRLTPARSRAVAVTVPATWTRLLGLSPMVSLWAFYAPSLLCLRRIIPRGGLLILGAIPWGTTLVHCNRRCILPSTLPNWAFGFSPASWRFCFSPPRHWRIATFVGAGSISPTTWIRHLRGSDYPSLSVHFLSFYQSSKHPTQCSGGLEFVPTPCWTAPWGPHRF